MPSKQDIKNLIIKCGIATIGLAGQFVAGDSQEAYRIAESTIKDMGDISKFEEKSKDAKRSASKKFDFGGYTFIVKD